MTKLQLILLKSILENKESLNLDVIVSLIEATGNVEVALEMLAGVYEKPNICTWSPKDYQPAGHVGNIVFESYNDFTGEITFRYQEQERRYGYRLKGTEPMIAETPAVMFETNTVVRNALNLSLEDFDAQYSQGWIYGGLKTDVKTGTCTLEQWQGADPAIPKKK